jgi:hypothetical protein
MIEMITVTIDIGILLFHKTTNKSLQILLIFILLILILMLSQVYRSLTIKEILLVFTIAMTLHLSLRHQILMLFWPI